MFQKQTVEDFLSKGGKISKPKTHVKNKVKSQKRKKTRYSKFTCPPKPKGLDKRFLLSVEWAKIKLDILEIVKYKCQDCGSKRFLQIHHLTYDRYGGEEEPSDLVCLCAKCHLFSHGISKKRK